MCTELDKDVKNYLMFFSHPEGRKYFKFGALREWPTEFTEFNKATELNRRLKLVRFVASFQT